LPLAGTRTRGLLTDTSRLRRLPGDQGATGVGQQGGRNGGRGTGSSALGFNQHDIAEEHFGIMPDGFAGLSDKAELWIPPAMAARVWPRGLAAVQAAPLH
jgi:hypothetical protein